MAERRKIGIVYHYNENWIGGTYYIQNLIAALNNLPDDKKPFIVIFALQAEADELIKYTGYPYIERRDIFRKLTIGGKIINFISRKVLNKNLLPIFHKDVNILFPATNQHQYLTQKSLTFLYWIPDFQAYYLPEFFDAAESIKIKAQHGDIVANGKYIVFSSLAAQADFNTFYPLNNLKHFVVPFAVTHTNFIDNANGIREKYGMPEKFFMCSNQFWKHKNHITVIEAVALLKSKGLQITVGFTGKERDTQSSAHFKEIETLIDNYNLKENIRLLGFISRQDQLLLLKQSIAVIQPSLFEGWSTVIEDAKSLNTYIIASDINVNREQLQSYTAKQFFSPMNEAKLADCMEHTLQLSPAINYNYQIDITNYANSFISILSEIK